MKLVVDTNVLLSAFISDSTTRHLIRDLDGELYAPAELRHEVTKYDDLIQDRSGYFQPSRYSMNAFCVSLWNAIDTQYLTKLGTDNRTANERLPKLSS